MHSFIFNFKSFFALSLLVFLSTINHVFSFDSFNFPSFPDTVSGSVKKTGDSGGEYRDALQVTYDNSNASLVGLSGRVVFHKKFTLWNKKGKVVVADFNSTFVINVHHEDGTGGEGLAFILSKDYETPANSDGRWLGIVNAATNGSSENNIVAVEFDTSKSFPEDIDSNHVGLNINTVYSTTSASLNSSGIVIEDDTDITAMVLFNGSTSMMNVYVFKGNTTTPDLPNPIISTHVNLSRILPSDVYIGFSASTGSFNTELNCVKAWFFSGTNLDDRFSLWLKIMVSVLISVALVLILSLGGGYLYWQKKKKRVESLSNDGMTMYGIEAGLVGPKKMMLKDIKDGTGNFNAKNELGRGGFGVVYLGNLDGIEVAVKRIENTPAGKQNLIAEVTTIGSVHHKNLVKLIGWCHENNELILVYEYMPNRSLDHYIDVTGENDHDDKPVILTWERRHRIVCGVAQAVDYLHNECSKRVLHRDIKDSNIMLDSEFNNACLGDFGLARMFRLSEKTHHSTKDIAGTPGYMAPEIFHTGRATSETDVYAFGVLALVVACGKKAVFETQGSKYRTNIVELVWELHSLDRVVEAVDPKLEGEFDRVQAECMLALGLACCHPNPCMRPSMRNALQILMGESLPPVVAADKPPFVWPPTSPSILDDDSSSNFYLEMTTNLRSSKPYTTG